MAFIPIPEAIKASIEFTIGGQVVVITLGWKKGAPIIPDDLDALNAALDDWVSTHLFNVYSDDMSAIKAVSTDLTSESAPSRDRVFSPSIPGAQTGANVPQNVAAVISFITGQRGRSYRGRNYIPGIPVDAQPTTGVMTSTFANGILTAYAGLADVESATGLTHAVLSRFHNKAPRTTGVATPVTGYVVNFNLDSQRRRLPGRGT